MKLQMKLLTRFALLGVLGTLLTSNPVQGADALTSLFGDPIIAKGKNVEVKRSQLDEAFISYRANLAARGEDIPDDQRVRKEIGLLERIILTQILAGKASESDRTNANAVAKKFLDEARKSAGNSEAAFERHLRALGLTGAKFETRVKEQSLVETILDRELKPSIQVSDADVRKFYAENSEKFKQPEIAKGQHIIVYTKDPQTGTELSPDQARKKKERLQRAQTRAKAGEDFFGLIKEYSEDPSLEEKRGEFLIPRLGKLPEIESAVFSLPINSVSEIITTPAAFHVVKVLERSPARQTEFEKVEEDIKKHLSHREMEKKLPEFFTKLKAEAQLDIQDKKYLPVLETSSADAFDNSLGK